jgi:hypothetical protein
MTTPNNPDLPEECAYTFLLPCVDCGRDVRLPRFIFVPRDGDFDTDPADWERVKNRVDPAALRCGGCGIARVMELIRDAGGEPN